MHTFSEFKSYPFAPTSPVSNSNELKGHRYATSAKTQKLNVWINFNSDQ